MTRLLRRQDTSALAEAFAPFKLDPHADSSCTAVEQGFGGHEGDHGGVRRRPAVKAVREFRYQALARALARDRPRRPARWSCGHRRSTVNSTGLPTPACSRAAVRSDRRRTGRPFTSDDDVADLARLRVDASQAGRCGGRAGQRAHDHDALDPEPRRDGLLAPAMMPIPGVGMRPLRISSGTTRFTTSTGSRSRCPPRRPRARRSPC